MPLSSETHAGEDIAIYGYGPGSYAVTGTNEQSNVFHVMERAARWEKQAGKKLANQATD